MPKYNYINNRFINTLDNELSFVTSLNMLRRFNRGRHYNVSKERIEKICEMSFLIIFVSWELYLDSMFQHYIVFGKNYKQFVKPLVEIKNLRTCAKVLIGEKRFSDWSEPQNVQKRAEIYFANGEPFKTTIGSMKIYFERIKCIRNMIAHSSGNAADNFHKMIRDIYGVGRRISPGGLLLERPPTSLLPISSGTVYNSIYELFNDIYKTAITQIAP
jgi:hypothetical protein